MYSTPHGDESTVVITDAPITAQHIGEHLSEATSLVLENCTARNWKDVGAALAVQHSLR